MLDCQPSPATAPAFQRAKGVARGAFHVARGSVRLRDLYQEGCAKLMLPKVHAPVPEAVFLNTSGGVTGDDRLSYALDVGDGAEVLATTQTAERAYASQGPAGQVDVHLTVGDSARLAWLPQETILFNHAHLRRRTVVDLAPNAEVLMAEGLVLGRAAMGEGAETFRLSDHRLVRRAGRPVWFDPFGCDGAASVRGHVAGLDGASALGSIALIGPRADQMRLPTEQDLHGARVTASAWDGKLLVRVLAPSGLALRRAMGQILTILNSGTLPRVWQSEGVG